jgi:hypothetical protein
MTSSPCQRREGRKGDSKVRNLHGRGDTKIRCCVL